jgi:hypothetical protein
VRVELLLSQRERLGRRQLFVGELHLSVLRALGDQVRADPEA